MDKRNTCLLVLLLLLIIGVATREALSTYWPSRPPRPVTIVGVPEEDESGWNQDEDNGVLFEAVTQPIWEMPRPRTIGEVEMALRITNNSDTDYLFTLINLKLELRPEVGKRLPVESVQDHMSFVQPVHLRPHETQTIPFPARLAWIRSSHYPELMCRNLTGGEWVIHEIRPTNYWLSFRFENRRMVMPDPSLPPETAESKKQARQWFGRVRAREAPFEVHLPSWSG